MGAAAVERRKTELRAIGQLVRDHKANLARRDALIQRLWADGVPRDELAELAGVVPARISQVTGAA